MSCPPLVLLISTEPLTFDGTNDRRDAAIITEEGLAGIAPRLEFLNRELVGNGREVQGDGGWCYRSRWRGYGSGSRQRGAAADGKPGQ